MAEQQDGPDPGLLEVLQRRRSTRAFDPSRPVGADALRRVLEAARWAPSSGNAQPWRYVVCDEAVAEARARARDLLRPRNGWARAAPVLLLATAAVAFPARAEKPSRRNPHAWHDVGAASMALSLQAVAEGLVVHEMAGFDRDAARAAFRLPEDVEAVALIALGHPGSPAGLPDDLAAREGAPRGRRELGEIAVRGSWDGDPLT